MAYCNLLIRQVAGCGKFISARNTILNSSRSFSAAKSKMDTTLFREIFAEEGDGDGPAGVINLVQGAPGVKHLGLASNLMKSGTDHLLNDPAVAVDNYVLQYGPRLGSTHAREGIAKFLSRGYGDEVDSDSIVVTGGATNGLQLACTHFLKEGDVVFVEDPTYFIAIMMLKHDLKMKVVSVPADDKGIDVDAYEKLVEQHIGSGSSTDPLKPFRAMLYMVPTYNNPRGHTLSPDRCRRLVQIARKYDVLNFCDDVYNLLHFDVNTRAPPRFITYDNPADSDFKGHTVSNGTFSKILAPGLRLGWYESSTRIVESFRKSNILWSAGCTNHYAAEVVATICDLGLEDKHVKDMNTEYKEKLSKLYAVMEEAFPKTVKFNRIDGGYFIWIQMPEGSKGVDVVKLAMAKYKVRVMPGASCSPTGSFQNCLRLSISYHDEDVLLEGAKRLGKALHEYLGA